MKSLLILLFISLLFISPLLNAQNNLGSTYSVSRGGTLSSPSRESIQAKIDKLTAAIALDRNNPNLYSDRSFREYHIDLYDSAIADINTAIRLDTTKKFSVLHTQRNSKGSNKFKNKTK